MTPKQRSYIEYRIIGLGQAQAAIKAGYASASAKTIASRMEKLPEIRAAIDAGLAARYGQTDEPPEFEDAQSYLAAVVKGLTPPDPVRVGAARALLPFERARQRAPVKSATPRQMDRQNRLAAEQDLLDAWAEKAARVRQRLKQK
ncbi:MAG: terminase small subunit [Gallionella sp.]